MTVADLLKLKDANPPTVRSEMPLADLAKHFAEAGVSAAVVAGPDAEFSGIVTKGDLVWALANFGAELAGYRVGDIMTKRVFTAHPVDTVLEVMQIMLTNDISHLPVVVDGRLVGMVSRRDLVNHHIQQAVLDAASLERYPPKDRIPA